jgi:putative hydrolase of the HAD superfamily
MAIKTIIFDIGGVVMSTDFPAIYSGFGERIGLTAEDVIKYHKENFDEIILGNITFQDFWDDMKKLGGNPDLDYKKIWMEEGVKNRKFNPGVIDIVKKLREKYSIGTLTNLSPHRLMMDEEIDLYSNFDYTVLSCVEHLKKPDPEIYKLALKRADVKPEEAVFVDDKEVFTNPAEKLGIKTIVYSYPNNEKFLRDLKDLGL